MSNNVMIAYEEYMTLRVHKSDSMVVKGLFDKLYESLVQIGFRPGELKLTAKEKRLVRDIYNSFDHSGDEKKIKVQSVGGDLTKTDDEE